MHLEEKKSDPLFTLANIKELDRLGWKAKINFADGIKKCFTGV
jgi:hypothetical protein